MSPSRVKSRRLSEDERKLWREVTRRIAPLRRLVAEMEEDEAELTPPKTAPMRTAKPLPKSVPAKTPPAPVPLGRREKSKVARGRAGIDRRLDLHGHTQAEAHSVLLHFLRKASSDGAKLVLVITGKSGVLKRQVPLWLGLPEFRTLIVGYDTAHQRHGGEGALYLRLRRA
jgi:DNA-nicking Smr family endonuclease